MTNPSISPVFRIEYNPVHGEAVPDGAIQYRLYNIIDAIRHDAGHQEPIPLSFSTGNIFFALLAAVKDGRVKHTGFEFLYKDTVISISEQGSTMNTPPGFSNLEMVLFVAFFQRINTVPSV